MKCNIHEKSQISLQAKTVDACYAAYRHREQGKLVPRNIAKKKRKDAYQTVRKLDSKKQKRTFYIQLSL